MRKIDYVISSRGALSKRFEYDAGTGSSPGGLLGGLSYEYDGLNLLRVDELYDPGGNGLSESDPWRKREVMVHRPGGISALVGKTSSPRPPSPKRRRGSSKSPRPFWERGNRGEGFLEPGFRGEGNGDEAYHFAQDAFGNELPLATLGGDDWSNAASAGVTERQTGKWIDPFTGMYYFWARWYQADVGRFVGRDKVRQCHSSSFLPYAFVRNSPLVFFDADGNEPRRWGFEMVTRGIPIIGRRCCREQRERMVTQIERSCDILQARIVEIPREGVEESQQDVKDCVLGRCRAGKITCVRRCKDFLGRTFPREPLRRPGELIRVRRVEVCKDQSPGATAIHEWGHECSCSHPEGDPGGGSLSTRRSVWIPTRGRRR